MQWHIDGLLNDFLATLVWSILRNYWHVHIHSYGESILHIMQGVLRQLMSVNDPKINWSVWTMKVSFIMCTQQGTPLSKIGKWNLSPSLTGSMSWQNDCQHFDTGKNDINCNVPFVSSSWLLTRFAYWWGSAFFAFMVSSVLPHHVLGIASCNVSCSCTTEEINMLR